MIKINYDQLTTSPQNYHTYYLQYINILYIHLLRYPYDVSCSNMNCHVFKTKTKIKKPLFYLDNIFNNLLIFNTVQTIKVLKKCTVL